MTAWTRDIISRTYPCKRVYSGRVENGRLLESEESSCQVEWKVFHSRSSRGSRSIQQCYEFIGRFDARLLAAVTASSVKIIMVCYYEYSWNLFVDANELRSEKFELHGNKGTGLTHGTQVLYFE